VSEALFIQHTKHMHHITLSPVACLALPYLSTSQKGTMFEIIMLNN